MKVFLDFTSRAAGGGLTFLNNFIFNLSKAPSDNLYYIFLHAPLSFSLPHNFITTIVRPFFPYEAWKVIWYNIIVTKFLKREKIDIFYGSTGIGPLGIDCPSVLTLQNLWPFLSSDPSLSSTIIKYLRRQIIIKCSQNASLLHLTSFSAYQTHVKMGLNVDYKKVRIIPFGIENIFFNGHSLLRADTLIRNFNLRDTKYILFVGNIFEHKNIETLLKAFAIFYNNYNDKDIKIVIAGKVMKQRYVLSLNKLVNDLGIKNNVVFTGEVNYYDLPLLYALADLFLFPSTLETFGFPMVEAMASKVPLLVADTPIAREICGDAALYFPALGQEKIADLILKVIKDYSLKQSLVEKGLNIAKRFCWEEMVQKMLALFSEAVLLKKNE